MPKHSSIQLTRDLEKVIGFFNRHQVPYLLIGGLALSLWGRPRTTLDLDFLVQVDEEGLEKLKVKARKEGFKIDARWLRWNPLLKGSQIRLRAGNVAVDLMTPRDEHDRAAFGRKKHFRFGRKPYFVIGPEDFILQKLKVGRPRDFEDAVTVLERMRGKLDFRYLRKWARKLGILGELNCILSL